MELLYKYLIVIVSSMLKFFVGPMTGRALGLGFWETYLCTVTGMMLTVFLLTYLGEGFRKWFISKWIKDKRKFTKTNRRAVKVWRKFREAGIAFLTPPLFTPPFGTIILVAFRAEKQKIYLYMLISSLIWGLLVCLSLFVIPFEKWFSSL